MIKKSNILEYLTKVKKGIAVMKLDEDDKIIGIIMSNNDEDKVAIIGSNNYYNCYPLKDISCTGRNTKGVKAIKLAENEYVKEIKKVKEEDNYKVTGRAVKGVKNE